MGRKVNSCKYSGEKMKYCSFPIFKILKYLPGSIVYSIILLQLSGINMVLLEDKCLHTVGLTALWGLWNLWAKLSPLVIHIIQFHLLHQHSLYQKPLSAFYGPILWSILKLLYLLGVIYLLVRSYSFWTINFDWDVPGHWVICVLPFASASLRIHRLQFWKWP